MMSGIIGGVDGRWGRVRVVQRCHGTTGWCWVSSRSGADQRTDQTVTRMRRMRGGIMAVMMRDLNGTNVAFLLTNARGGNRAGKKSNSRASRYRAR